jgi:heme/copper-type cytochrome/quinol oxidase subunit 3
MTRGSGRLHLAAESNRTPVVPNGALGMLIFVLSEMMLFAGLISAFQIIKSAAVIWPPPDQPRLPIEATAFNTAVLLASAGFLYQSWRVYQRDREAAERPLTLAIGLGAFFVLFQGFEWVRLVGQGLTMTSSSLGSFFYLIVGIHALHVSVALGVLVHTWRKLRAGWIAHEQLLAAQVLWYFVVGLWPVLYGVVYL